MRKANNKIYYLNYCMIKELEAENEQLKLRIARLEKTSKTSSKSSSLDIVKAKKVPTKTNKKIGAQPGHPQHKREKFADNKIDEHEFFKLDICTHCNKSIPADLCAEHSIQQIEIVEKPIKITEFHAYKAKCPHCFKKCNTMPRQITKLGLSGANLTTLIAYLKGVCHCSFTTIQKYIKAIYDMDFSTGYIAKIINKASEALSEPYEEMYCKLWTEDVLNIDETGHRNNGVGMWAWCFRGSDHTMFRIEKSRGTCVLEGILTPEYKGKIISDFYGAYRKFSRLYNTPIQYCLAHLIRDIKFLTTLPKKEEVEYGDKLLSKLKELFITINDDQNTMQNTAQLTAIKDDFLSIALKENPPNESSNKIYKRLLKNGDKYFSFISHSELSPTNNKAEQAIRHLVIDRKVTQGTRGNNGMRWSERIWTVNATCAIKNISSYDYLQKAISAFFEQTPFPSLL